MTFTAPTESDNDECVSYDPDPTFNMGDASGQETQIFETKPEKPIEYNPAVARHKIDGMCPEIRESYDFAMAYHQVGHDVTAFYKRLQLDVQDLEECVRSIETFQPDALDLPQLRSQRQEAQNYMFAVKNLMNKKSDEGSVSALKSA